MYLNRNELSKQKGLFPFSHIFFRLNYTHLWITYMVKKNMKFFSLFSSSSSSKKKQINIHFKSMITVTGVALYGSGL